MHVKTEPFDQRNAIPAAKSEETGGVFKKWPAADPNLYYDCTWSYKGLSFNNLLTTRLLFTDRSVWTMPDGEGERQGFFFLPFSFFPTTLGRTCGRDSLQCPDGDQIGSAKGGPGSETIIEGRHRITYAGLHIRV